MSLEKNLFFRTLFNQYRSLYQEAVENCMVILIPNLEGNEIIDRQAILTHILRPSPFLKEHFIPQSKTEIRDIELEDNLLKINREIAKRDIQDEIRILKEETAYNSKNKKIAIYLIEEPLIKLKIRSGLKSPNVSDLEQFSDLSSFNQCQKYLTSLSPQITHDIEVKLIKLLTHYEITADGLNDARQKFSVIIEWAFERFLEKRAQISDVESLQIAIESFVIGKAYEPLYKVIVQQQCEKDCQVFDKLYEIELSGYNVASSSEEEIFFNYELDDDVEKLLRQLDLLITPMEKLTCLKNAYELIEKSLCTHSRNMGSSFKKNGQSVFVTSEIILAGTIFTLSRVKPTHLSSNIYYISWFNWHLPDQNEHGYALSLFESCMRFALNFKGSRNCRRFLEAETRDSGNFRDIPRIMFDSSSSSEPQSPPEKSFDASESSRKNDFNADLENLTQIMSENRICKHANRGNASEDDEELGSFLSHLKRNKYLVHSGKQV